MPPILIAEDDSATCALYQRVLGSILPVIICSDHISVLQVLRRQPIQVVVLEPNVAYGQGWTVLTVMQATPQLRTVPVVVCSSIDARRYGLALGGAVYLVKPVSPDVLVAAVQQFV